VLRHPFSIGRKTNNRPHLIKIERSFNKPKNHLIAFLFQSAKLMLYFIIQLTAMAREEDSQISSRVYDGQPMVQPPKPILPQYDAALQQRKDYLKKQCEEYQFDTFDFLPSLPLLKALPPSEKPPASLFGKRGVLSSLVLNVVLLKAKARQESFVPLSTPMDPLHAYEGSLAELSGTKLPGYADLQAFLPPSVDEYKEMEQSRPVYSPTKVIGNYKKDAAFAEQRLSGVNPLVIQRLGTEQPEVLKQLLLKVTNVGETGNLYFADYHTKLPVVRGGTYKDEKKVTVKDEKGNDRQKHLPRPIALFRLENGQLLPVAIQLEAHREESIFTPSDDPTDWLIAKLCVQIADANHHELITHLCRTHLVIEAIAVVTARELDKNHPLKVLFQPHFRFMLSYNDGVRDKLINLGGPIDALMAGSLRGAEDILKEGYRTWNFDQFVFPKEIEQRGMSKDNIPHYPYRDDGMLVWEAIEKFVGEYLKLYYTKPEDITGDTELQAWAREIQTVFEGKGFPGDFQTLDSLVEFVTSIIFVAGPQHSAINYAQYEYMAFAPNMPFAAYGPLPQKGQPSQPDRLVKFLPPPSQAIGQLLLAHGLSAYQYDHLGYYLPDDFTDPSVLPLIQEFKTGLATAESTIEERNGSRPIAYPYFKPSLSLNSISI
jgi:arachidonate 15-lipoxygenase